MKLDLPEQSIALIVNTLGKQLAEVSANLIYEINSQVKTQVQEREVAVKEATEKQIQKRIDEAVKAALEDPKEAEIIDLKNKNENQDH